LWKRTIFNIAISNTDDHLRIHRFVLREGGWRLSPAYVINPSVDKEGLALKIDTSYNAASFPVFRKIDKTEVFIL
jgi:serine/threonine-protein kinase HipA